VLLLCACTHAGSSRGWGTAHVLRIAIVNDPSSLNPLFVTSQNAVDLGQLYTETLVGLSPDNRVVPLLAQRWSVSPDGLTITYRLRRDARFADGVAVTSADVAFTYRVIMDPRNPVTSAQPYRQIASLTTPDKFTVVVRLRRPWAAAASELFAESDYAYGILPAHAFGGSTDLSRSGWNQKPFGSGPFRVAQWRHGDEIVLEPNPYAWRKPHLRRLIY
jgi:peptide/nickel transport system substrate-binding protein